MAGLHSATPRDPTEVTLGLLFEEFPWWYDRVKAVLEGDMSHPLYWDILEGVVEAGINGDSAALIRVVRLLFRSYPGDTRRTSAVPDGSWDG